MIGPKPEITPEDFSRRAPTEKLALCKEDGTVYVISLARFQHGGPSLEGWVGKDITARFNEVHPLFKLKNKPAARAAIVAKISAAE